MGQVRNVLYAAAHGGFAGQAIPLGGGAAVCNLLQAEWARTQPFELTLLGPSILGDQAPSGRDLVRFNEREYAAFCDAFRDAVTREALRRDPGTTAILVNDVSEGPNFVRLHAAGFRIVTIYHVDVVAYIAAIYLKGRLRPRTLTRIWEGADKIGLDRLAPQILRLIFAQQRASLHGSQTIAVPSAGMKDVLRDCYPEVQAERIEVVPWGAPPEQEPEGEIRREFGVPPYAPVLLCLSRISPEKGQDLLLQSLLEWERQGQPPGDPIWLFICGEPAFMQGERHMAKLRGLAARLKKIRVVFPGYVGGGRKQAFFQMADLYVFPSRHESYGLTLMEAFRAGLPAVCLEHQGSRELMRDEFGALLRDPRDLARTIERLLQDRVKLAAMGAAAAQFAASHPFHASAARIAELLVG